MNITEVRVKLISDEGERLRAFCSVTFDGEFVIRDIKVIEGTSGPFVAMPSRKLADKCRKCGCKNHLRAKFCNECGARLNEQRAGRDPQGRVKLHADVAHPIKPACREQMQNAVLEAYRVEAERAKQPGYRPASLDDDRDDGKPDAAEYSSLVAELRESATRRGGTAKEPAGPGEFSGGERDEAPDSKVERAAADDRPSDQTGVLTPVSAPVPTRTPGGDDDGFGVGIV